jgi:choline-sulfatase
MIVHSPQHFRPRRVQQPVSLADILPTLVELAGDGRPMSEYCAPIDGRSLLPHLSGSNVDVPNQSTVLGEYLAEGALAPLVMLRRDRFKFIHTSVDADQLFDLQNDPDELHNLASEQKKLIIHFHSEVKRHWGDLQSLHKQVLSSQRRRRFVAKALATGTYTAWDWQPVRDARNMYVRSHIPLDDIEAMARFPRVEKRSTLFTDE